MRAASWSPGVAAMAVMMAILAAPAHALSRYNDGDVTVAVVDGAACFTVERYLGPISLFHTRKFRPRAGQFAVSSVHIDSGRQPLEAVWLIQAPEEAAGWGLDPGQCIPLGTSPEGARTELWEHGLPLPPGLYHVTLRTRDLHRGLHARLTAKFCVMADGALHRAIRHPRGDSCAGEPIPAGSFLPWSPSLLASP